MALRNVVPTLGRTTQGVRIMRLDEDDLVVSVGLVSDDGAKDDDNAAEKDN